MCGSASTEANDLWHIMSAHASRSSLTTICIHLWLQPKHYHEPGVGEALQRLATRHGLPRSQLWLQTKFTPLSGQDPKRVPYDVKAPLQDQVRAACVGHVMAFQ